MSLFGGDQPLAEDDHSISDFSVSPISSPEGFQNAQRQSEIPSFSQSAQLDNVDLDPASVSDADDEDGDASDSQINVKAHVTNHQITRRRFEGSDALWKKLNHDERMLKQSLDQLQTSDLAVHLYNAHNLKARARREEAANAAKSALQIRPDEQVPDPMSKAWQPLPGWTAWPLPPEKVPRPGETSELTRRRDLASMNVRQNVHQSREDLQEDIRACFLKQASAQWHARPDANASLRKQSPSPSIPRSGRSRSASQTSETARSSADETDRLAPSAAQQQRQADESLKQNVKLEPEEVSENIILPVLSADEDRSTAISQPIVNHVLSRLDDLFTGMHHNRVGHYAMLQSDSDAGSSRASSLTRSQDHKTRAAQARKGLSKGRRASAQGELSASKGHLTSETESRSPKRRRSNTPARSRRSARSRTSRSGSVSRSDSGDSDSFTRSRRPRDWSEVLGIAALIGWDDEALKHTSERCSALFNQRMDFRQFSPSGKTTTNWLAKVPSPSPPSVPPSPASGYFCPISTCSRRADPFALNLAYRWRDHIKRNHHWTDIQIHTLEKSLIESGAVVPKRTKQAPQNTKNWTPPTPLLCPHENCERVKGKPFEDHHRFLTHLKRKHGYDPRFEDGPAESSTEVKRKTGSDKRKEEEERKRLGWNPPDPLVCLVEGCPKSIVENAKFDRPIRVVKHMIWRHGIDPRQTVNDEGSGDRGAESGTALLNNREIMGYVPDETDLVGGIPNDGFMEMIEPFVESRSRPRTGSRRKGTLKEQDLADQEDAMEDEATQSQDESEDSETSDDDEKIDPTAEAVSQDEDTSDEGSE